MDPRQRPWYRLLISKLAFSKQGLLSALSISDEVPSQDLERCHTRGKLLSLEDQDRVKWIMRSHNLKDWLEFPQSKTLLINGNGEGNEVFSMTTFLCAMLSDAVGCIEPIITLKFFCSLHTTPRSGTDHDAIGLVRSLIEQLVLHNVGWDLAFLSQKDLDKLEANDFDTLCKIFRHLVRQLPRMTLLYWMIDGITYYERADRRSDFLKAIDELLNIIDDCDKVVIKLLLTCHGRSAYVKDYIQDDDILLVPSVIDGDDQGLNDYVWDRRMENDLASLEDTIMAKEE